MDFPVFEAAPHVSGTQGKWALSAGRLAAPSAPKPGAPKPGAPNAKTNTRNKLIVLGGVVLAVLIVGFVLVLPALAGDSADKAKPSPTAATPTTAPTSASPSPPRPSASAAGGEYVAPYVPPPAPKQTTESPDDEDGDWDDGDWDDGGWEDGGWGDR
jgi:hypothetical protein